MTYANRLRAASSVPRHNGIDPDLLCDAASALDACVEALEHCLREHGGFSIRGETERKARAAIRHAVEVEP